ncbi:MAG: hypothetical protein M5U01_09725 [Ardenticatenaceae bacterium]|nr:hypothetical protein [Ardenticatenaceae bacterium]
MTQQNATDHLSWWAAQLRLTAFPSPATPLGLPENWWQDVVGEAPETVTLQRKEAGLQERGRFAGRQLELKVVPGRIDWEFNPIEDEREDWEINGISTTGPFQEALSAFLPRVHNWFQLETCPPVRRLAFGAVLVSRVDNRQEGYRQLAAYLRRYVLLDPENSSDFLYQINRPRASASGIEGLAINRLSKWSVGVLRMGRFAFGRTAIEPHILSVKHTCRLELDINTNAEYPGELDQQQMALVLNELVRLGEEISREGDIP